jgi:hypothetical protein
MKTKKQTTAKKEKYNPLTEKPVKEVSTAKDSEIPEQPFSAPILDAGSEIPKGDNACKAESKSTPSTHGEKLPSNDFQDGLKSLHFMNKEELFLNACKEDVDIKLKKSLPFIIKLRNLTESKLCDVELLNFDFDKQDKIRYSCLGGVDYRRMLLQFITREYQIGAVRYFASHHDPTYKEKQVDNVLRINQCNANGCTTSIPVGLSRDIYQNQNNIIDSHDKFTLNVLTSMKLGHLCLTQK